MNYAEYREVEDEDLYSNPKNNMHYNTQYKTSRKKSSSPVLCKLRDEIEDLGYYPTSPIVAETQLNLNKITKSKVGQKIHAFCLSGPPGAGKSFYVETYIKLIKKRVKKPVEIVSYQCHAKTNEQNLYENINIAAAIKGDSEKVVVSGKLVQAIDLANSGNIVILFLDEYDKAGEEIDTFFYNFLQDGVVDTTQRGKVVLNEDCWKNLQLFLCKNDVRETLSGPLTRRLKFLELDYMTPEILCKTINRKLGHIDSSLRDAVVLLYTSMYQTLPEHNQEKGESRFEFSRLPAASECMQAIEDAWELMEIGVDQSDIVLNGIVANMVKTKDDLEQFKALTKSKNELVIWYNNLMKAIGSNNQNYIEDVKQQMARQFFPEEIKRATRDIEEEGKRRKAQLEEQYKSQQQELQGKIDEAKQQLQKYENKLKELKKLEKDITKKEKLLQAQREEVERLRENAQNDAKEVADRYLKIKENELDGNYKHKIDELELLEKETKELRERADEDALEKAKKALAEEKTEIEEFLKKQKEEMEEKIKAANQQIREHNMKVTDTHEQEEAIQIYEQELLEYKKLIEKLLGRSLTEQDFANEKTEDVTIPIGNNGDFRQTLDNNEEVQDNIIFTKSGSVFDNSKNGMWIDIGEITLEKHKDKNMIFNSDFLRNLTEAYETNGIYKDGMVIYNGNKIKIIAIRVLEEEREGERKVFKNKFKFYANSTVLHKYALLDLCNFINYITPGGKYIPASVTIDGKERKLNFTQPIKAELNCMVYSNEKYDEINTENYTINKQGEKEYLVSYQNTIHKQLSEIAKEIFNTTRCSRKNIPIDKIRESEQEAYILHSKNLGVQGLVELVPEIEY